MSPGSPAQDFEQRMDALDRDVRELVALAERNPGVVAVQDARVMLFLSYLQSWQRQAPAKIRVVR